jgi:hypothetical protein
MKTSASRKYVTVHTIRRANSTLMAGERSVAGAPLQGSVTVPSRETIVNAGNNAVARFLAKTKVIV